MVERIIAAIDYSDSSTAVVNAAITLARSTGAQLKLLHVLTPKETQPNLSLEQALRGWSDLPSDPHWTSISAGVYEDITAAYQHHLEVKESQRLELMGPYLVRCEQSGVIADPVLIPGEPGRTLCDYGALLRCQSIVMGRRGRSGWLELILGSVSNYVLHHANCPVLIINAEPRSQVHSPLLAACQR